MGSFLTKAKVYPSKDQSGPTPTREMYKQRVHVIIESSQNDDRSGRVRRNSFINVHRLDNDHYEYNKNKMIDAFDASI